MILLWVFLGIALVIILVATALGLVRAADRPWPMDEIDERQAEQLTRPDGNVTVLRPDDE